MNRKIFGYDPDEAYESFLKEPEKVAQPKSQVAKPVQGINPNEWVILPGTANYADTLVQLKRSLQGNNFNVTHALLQQDGHKMLTIRQYVDFLEILHSGNNMFLADGKTVLSEDGKNLVLKDILELRDPYRAEWLDAKFEINNGKMLIHYNHRMQNGVLVPNNTEELSDYLTQDKQLFINSWLGTTNRHGLPDTVATNGSLYYWAPTDGNVARFIANANRAVLDCDWGPAYANAGLGVRRARVK